MKLLKYLDIFFVVFGILIITGSKNSTTTWHDTVLTAFGGLLIGAAIAFASVRREVANKKRSKRRS